MKRRTLSKNIIGENFFMLHKEFTVQTSRINGTEVQMGVKVILRGKCGETITSINQKTLIINRLTGFRVLGAGLEPARPLRIIGF
jgi:hypothetical protein